MLSINIPGVNTRERIGLFKLKSNIGGWGGRNGYKLIICKFRLKMRRKFLIITGIKFCNILLMVVVATKRHHYF